MSRNALGIFQKTFAAAGDRSEITTFETDGYGSEYAIDQAPDRRGMNDVLAKVTAVCSDVNTYGAALPWDAGLTFALHATSLGSDGVLYVSQQAGNLNHDPAVAGNRPTYWKSLQEILSPQATTSAKGVAELATQSEVDARTDTQRIVTPAALRSAPFYTVQVNNTHSLTIPSQFVGNIAEFEMLSRGSICTGTNSLTWPSVNSFLCSMTVDVSVNTLITFKLFAVDDSVYIYEDGVLKASRVGAGSWRDAPLTLSFTLSAGTRLVQIVKNDSGSGSNSCDLMGNIIGPNVHFVKGL